MTTQNTPATTETRAGYWRRVLRPLFWWLLLVLAMFGCHQHQLAMERTRIKFSVFLQGVDAAFATAGKLDGQPVSIGQKISLGNHTLTLVNPKAEPFTTNFFGWYGGRDFGRIDLKRAMGTLTLTATPSALTIIIAGPEFSLTLTNSTGTNLTVPSDTYDIRAEYPHWSQVRNSTVFDRQTTSCFFDPQFGALHLTCNHDGATYQLQQLDGREIDSGELPDTITGLPSNRYQTTILYHHRQMQKTIFLKPDTTNEVPVEFRLGTAHLESTPAGASVESAEGGYLGQTPLDVPDLPAQTTQFRLFLSRYEPVTVAVDIVADQTTTCRTNLVGASYPGAMKAARQYLAEANYERAAQAIAEALDAKPGDEAALALQKEANTHLDALRQQQEQLKRPQLVFDSLCAEYPDSGLFKAYGLKTSLPAQDVSAAIVKALQAAPRAFEIMNSWAAPPETYETKAHQTFSLGFLGGTERICLLVVGQTKPGETQILFKVLEFQIHHVLQATSLSNATDDKQLIPVHSSQMQMNDALQARVRDGVQIVSDKIKQAIGQP